MDYAYEIIESICAGQDAYAQVEMLNELLSVVSNQQFKELIKREIDSICKKYGICPKCYSKLELKSWTEYRGVIGREPVYEKMNSLYCPFCGWEEK